MLPQSGSPAEQKPAQIQWPQACDFLFQKTMPDGTTPVRYKVGWGGRGGMKTTQFARALLISGANVAERYLCAREYQNSIKQSVHKTIADEITNLGMNYIYEVENTVIKWRGDRHALNAPRTEFFFEGLHGNIDRIKSYANIKRCWVEEGESTTKDSFEKLDPTIRAEGSEIWISMNVNLETDFMYDFFVLHPPPDALVRKLTWRDNPWFPDVLRRRMEHMKATDYDAYLNVWEGEPKLLLAGAVYAEELRAARAGGRICGVPHEGTRPVDITWDLGYNDRTAIWLTQQVGFELRFVDFYQNQQKPLEHYLEWLQARRATGGGRYVYGMCNLPHDAKAKQLGTKLSIEEQLVALYGRRNVRVLPRLSLNDGINAARSMFPQCYFDKSRCADGIQALSHYRYEVVDEKGSLSRIPVHDEYSHAADAFRYVALAKRQPRESIAQMRAKLQVANEDALRSDHEYRFGRPAKRGTTNWMRK